MADYSSKIIRELSNNDRISQLPDEVLCHILSFLPILESVSTCILSPRWNYLWRNISKLSFHYNSSESGNFVNGAMLLHNPLNLEKFSFRFCGNFKVDDVLRDAITKGIQFLDLCLNDCPTIRLPKVLFTSQTLQILRLEGKSIFIKVPNLVCLPNLTKMELVNVVYENAHSAYTLISSCCSLESLVVELTSFDERRTFSISSSTLKKIFIKIPEEMGNNALPGHIIGMLELKAPALQYLRLRDCSGLVDYLFQKLVSLEEADIDVSFRDDDPRGFNSCCVNRIYSALQHAKMLIINEDTFKVNYVDIVPMFHMLTVLKVTSNCCGWGMFESFLKNSPKLEDLTFTVDSKSVHYHKLRWINPESVPTCLMSNLKSISILSSTLFKVELEMAKYLLKNARILRSMKIRDIRNPGSKNEKNFFNELQKIRGASEGCVVSIG